VPVCHSPDPGIRPICDGRSRCAVRDRGAYLGRKRFEATFECAGLTMTFRGWAYALEEYGRALEQAGLLIEAVREPEMPVRGGEHEGSDERWRRLPMFLMMRVLKPAI
jgi:hypothetical protein